ncbi:ABC transporter ATP-binding protein [Synergistales bacterium]|nr:ABC transporter ATP-binding protein [Synergistales bacterium]
MNNPFLRVRNLKKYFPVNSGIFHRTKGFVKAVDDVSFTVDEGETLGLVGESGCGKSTTGRAILRLTPAEGSVAFRGEELLSLTGDKLRRARKDFQMIFQDPYASLDPRMTVRQIVSEPLSAILGRGQRREEDDKVAEILEAVGLGAGAMSRYPFEFSGGQRQRVGIARALITRPALVVADEPVSALDVSVQAQVINLLAELRERFNLTYLFIAHDLSVVRHISDRVAVMYLGRVVELAPKNALFDRPLHPYTHALLASVPEPDPFRKKERMILSGDVPSPLNPPSGCSFHPRCAHAEAICASEIPVLEDRGKGHFAACHFTRA